MSASKTSITPMMAQYLEIKAQYPDALLFYRMGDFYEMFFDDAIAAAETLNIALTKRGKHEGSDIPMCGVPHHSAEGYFLTLIRKGFRVAVCEQMESPAEAKKRGYKAVVHREVVRLVTPGTLTEDTLLNARRHNFLAAYSQVRDNAALAWVDISTGSLHVMPISPVRLGPELARMAPSELLVADGFESLVSEVSADLGIPVTSVSRGSFDSIKADNRVAALFKAASLEAFGEFSRSEIGALGAVVDYLTLTQKGKLPLLLPPSREASQGIMQIDAATRRNLELTESLSGMASGSLLETVDKTVTASGARMLQQRLSSPSLNLSVINNRLDSIDYMVRNRRDASHLTIALRQVPDMDRSLSRLSLDRGGPRDLAAIRNGLEQAREIAANNFESDLPHDLAVAVETLSGHEDLYSLLHEALVEAPPLLARDGGFIAQGFDNDLDASRTLRDEGRGFIAQLQAEYIKETGIQSLKIKHNNVLGYFIETTAKHANAMMSSPMSETFIHRQTTANQVRFTTVALSEMETKILNAGNRTLEIEKRLYYALQSTVFDKSAGISAASRGLAELDLACGLAEIAVSENWCRPSVNDSRAFEIENGRHPVVEASLRRTGEPFVANTCNLSGGDFGNIWLLTGPNMAGKSTFLRQNALIALLAQMGSFVPATSAQIGLVSQLFSRVGASDDLARGRSTFMVEMVETAAILNQADDRALVILDEIGRGTATYDGLSIAWATLEHLHDVNKSRALFATHYHEMTQLAGKMSGVANATVMVREWQGEVIFLHEVKKGAADRSYGVQVAQLAGLPPAVVERARVVLEALEKGEREGPAHKALIDDLPLFAASPVASISPERLPNLLEQRLAVINPDDLSARQALDFLYELKALSGD